MSHINNKSKGKISIPFWRDEKVLRVLIQSVFVVLLSVFVIWILSNVNSNYDRLGLKFSFSFLDDAASFDISEGIKFSPSDSYSRAFIVGVVNTLRISVIGILFATILGFLAGIARLSSNWLVSRISGFYIELIRNTPLLVQLFIWYFAVMAKLPDIKDSIVLPGHVFLSNRGVVGPWLSVTDSFHIWWPFVIVGAAACFILNLIRRRSINELGRPRFNIMWIFLIFLVIPALAWIFIPQSPFVFDLPEMISTSKGIVLFEGGVTFTAMYLALLFGLIFYSGAYIAEVVRGGILSVQVGQAEAARSLGFSNGQVLRLVIIPQALRVIIPPLINQYLNLVKNSSLAIAIGFADLYAVSQTMLNQSGRTIEVFLMIMASYLAMSLTISWIMNIINKKMQIVER